MKESKLIASEQTQQLLQVWNF